VREPLTDRKILDGIVALFRQHGADIWYQRTAAELLPAGTRCAKCGGGEFSKEYDVLDVWFDSGSSHLAVLNERFGLSWPADVYMEGGDQYRGWFHSSLLVGTGLKGGAPYRLCVLNGWVLDGEGRAMHKSLGNVIEPDQIIRRHGAEMLRLWTASVEFNEDVRLSETILTRLVDAYRKLRNTFRYLLGNLSDSIRGPTQCRAPSWPASTSGFCSAPKTWRPAAACGTRISSSTRSITRSTPSPRWT